MPSCSQCGEENPAKARFCLACGAALSAAGGRETRKVVTVLFTDLVGSTELAERLDPESVRGVVSRYFEEMRAVLEAHGASIEKFIGDAIMAVFGIPLVHEDDALRAMRAAVAMRRRLQVLNEDLSRDWGVRLSVRTGVNTGEVMAGNPALGQAFVSGDTVNLAARLEQAAAPEGILIGESTWELGRGLIEADPIDPLTSKGKSAALAAWRLLAVRTDAAARPGGQLTPFIGRTEEVHELRNALDRALAERSCALVTVVGPPGIGKSRLVSEFTSSVGGRVRVVTGRCLPYGEGITYWPLVEIVNDVCGDDIGGTVEALMDDDASMVAARIAAAVGTAEAPGSPTEIFWAFRKLFEGLARKTPLVICVDDIHWAEPTLLDLLEYVTGFSSRAPMLMLCLARRELFDTRPSWAVPRDNATVVSLQPISQTEADRLIDRLAGHEFTRDARARIAAAAEGNPLFIEQLLALNTEAHVGNGAIEVPATIQALLAARIDLLQPAERAVIERAAIEGRSFHRGAVVELLDEDARSGVGRQLVSLVRKDFIQPAEPLFAGDDGFRFGHILIRDAAYAAVPKELRADLHERFADWLEQAAGTRVADFEEILAYHLEQAYRNQLELGRSDAASRLSEVAGRRLAHVGLRALDRGDMPAAVNLLTRAAAVLPNDDSQRLRILVEVALALVDTGDLARAEAFTSEALERAEAQKDEPAIWRARVAGIYLRARTASMSDEGLLAEAEAAAAACMRLSDDLGQARAWHVIGLLRSWLGSSTAASDEAFFNAIEHARRAGARRQEASALMWVLVSAWYGPTPATAGIRRCREVLSETSVRSVEAVVLTELGCFEALVGEFADARSHFARGYAMFEDLGEQLLAAGSSQEYFDIEMLAGDPEAAERRLRLACDTLEEMGERGFLATRLGLLAQAQYAQGRFAEADDTASRAREVSQDPGDYDAQFRWRVVRAKVLARRGEFDEAEALMREAVALVEPTDSLNARAHTLMDLAEVLQLAGRDPEALPHVQEAIRVFDAKENRVDAERARARLAELSGAMLAERSAG